MSDSKPGMSAPDSGVKVRMYRQGLGDCFLLAFPTRGSGRPCYVLIDCGVLLGTEDAATKMKKVAASLQEATGGRIDVLVATHQHWDHLSGFQQAKEVFDQIEIGQVWVAWTEDPNDAMANRLRARRETTVRALHAAAQGLRVSGDETSAGNLEAVLGFFGELGVDGRPSAIQQAMAYVLGRGNPPRYWRPGDRTELPGVDGVRVYVLGPPHDDKLLRCSDPTGSGQVYEQRMALDPEASFGVAALAMMESMATLGAAEGIAAGSAAATGSLLTGDEEEMKRLSFPFDKNFQVTLDLGRQDPFFQEHYFGVAGQPSEKEIAWRRIDTDWLGSAGQLGLQLDSDTNNTSLALAIELVGSGKVLLFAADAQVGNWLSWHSLQWPREGEPANPVTAADLLRRTVLYKVGHHASHNATLQDKGLELMTHPELVAMIPVDEAMAHKPKGGNPNGWDMPFAPLLARLKQKAKGRVLRVDSGAPPQQPEGISGDEWKEFQKKCDVQPDYVEITLAEPASPAPAPRPSPRSRARRGSPAPGSAAGG
ncbi:MAG TPA: MBL fold metallo-hydrolase [Thermoanaerobaculia bacterium]|nr:MBL fold metallo-hydrolase [Thermoanaerobaculia bacterium]